MLRYETFSSGFRLKKCTFDPTAVHSPCPFANLRLEISRFLVQAAQGFSEVRGSLCSHVVFVTRPPPPDTLICGVFPLAAGIFAPCAHTRASGHAVLFLFTFKFQCVLFSFSQIAGILIHDFILWICYKGTIFLRFHLI